MITVFNTACKTLQEHLKNIEGILSVSGHPIYGEDKNGLYFIPSESYIQIDCDYNLPTGIYKKLPEKYLGFTVKITIFTRSGQSFE